MPGKRLARTLLPVSLWCASCLLGRLEAQILYASAINTGGVATYFYINMATCESCIIGPTSPNIGTDDIVMLPDGTVLNISPDGIRRLGVPPAVNILWQTGNPQGYLAGQLAPNGLVYLVSPGGLASYNPANNTILFLGAWPPSVSAVYDVFYIDGVLYANGAVGSSNAVLIEVNLANPAQSIVTPTPLGFTDGEGGVYNGTPGLFYADASHTVYFFDPADESISTICDIDTDYSIISLTTLPPGLPNYACVPQCEADAGALAQGGPYQPCINSTLTFPAATQTTLGPDDLLQYVLFSNPADTVGSILAVSDTPEFTFAPPMQTGVPYYVAAVAGSELNGAVNLSDPCLDFSNALEVTWQPLPGVQLSAPSQDLCAGDCVSVQVVFTGTGPFALQGNVLSGGNIIATFNESFGSNTGAVVVCVPAGTAPGPVAVQATSVTDASCTCW